MLAHACTVTITTQVSLLATPYPLYICQCLGESSYHLILFSFLLMVSAIMARSEGRRLNPRGKKKFESAFQKTLQQDSYLRTVHSSFTQGIHMHKIGL